MTLQKSKLVKGFTLIELMVVVAIIGVLAAVAIPSFIDYIRKSKAAEVPSITDICYKGVIDYFGAPTVEITGRMRDGRMPVDTIGRLNGLIKDSAALVDCSTQAAVLNGASGYITPSVYRLAAALPYRRINFAIGDAIFGCYNIWNSVTFPAADGQTYACEAFTDLDDDGTLAHWWKLGTYQSEMSSFQGGGIWQDTSVTYGKF